MSRFHRPAILLASASIAAGILVAPSAAYAADTTTQLTKAQMKAELSEVAKATESASVAGWGGTYKVTISGAEGGATFAIDPTGGRAYYEFTVDRETSAGYAVANKGSYEHFQTRAEYAAAKLLGRPSAKFVFTTNTKLDLDDWVDDNEPRPSIMLADSANHAGTKTVHDDGSSTYSYEVPEDAVTTIEVGEDGVLDSVGVSYPPLLSQTLAYAYGPQTVTLPSADQTVSRAALTKALAYVDMPAATKDVATRSAKATLKAAKGKKVTVANLRKIARNTAAAHNATANEKVLAVTNVKDGVRVSAKNPYTGQKVSYTLKASGKKVIMRKA
ncbi:hypothetical protein AB0M02_30385 [Actinoplanes sp. NPDC051861]|uniref:hypothetical protein n=1 Tax=Actinoplanes sp. NPDC051861 TaxID=3155170 RepID=UPI00344A5243